jgi:menaquinone-dependent protoporphyrinogen oxidase
MGRWHGDALGFLKRHGDVLAGLPLAVFAMGPRTLDESDVGFSRVQLERALAKVDEVSPGSVAIFGGVLDPAKLRFPFKHMPASDARDWGAISDWAERVSEAFVEQSALQPA